jgi:hypothetical protein
MVYHKEQCDVYVKSVQFQAAAVKFGARVRGFDSVNVRIVRRRPHASMSMHKQDILCNFKGCVPPSHSLSRALRSDTRALNSKRDFLAHFIHLEFHFCRPATLAITLLILPRHVA